MRVRVVLTAFASLLLFACGPTARGGAKGPGAERPGAKAAAVSDDEFAGAVHDLLTSENGSSRRASLLAGVEARQMTRAAQRFHAHRGTRGLVAVTGGLYLVKTGELSGNLLGPSGKDALRGAVRELATRGDEGRARALYEILTRISGPEDQAELKTHLDALQQWTRDTAAAGGPVAQAGALENVTVTRHLLEPSDSSREEAVARTGDWIDKALQLRAAYRVKRVPPAREEAGEALRALGTGATVLAAVFLRDADAKGALEAIDKAQARELARPELVKALEQAAEKPDAGTWLEIVHVLRPPPSRDREEEETVSDQDLIRSASFASAIEAYRLDPTLPEAAGAVAAALEELGMGEASPAILTDTVKAHPDPRVLSGALAITMHAMASEVEAEDADAARRAYKAAVPVLAVADQKPDKLSPSAARVRAMMGEIELREGRLDDARQLLTTSVQSEKAGAVYLSLARIDWHDGKTAAALDHLREALASDDATKDPALRGEILLTTSDVTRDQGDLNGARTPLTEALRELAKARSTPDGEDRARVERLLSRVLDRFGAAQPAQRALERAFDAAPRDKRQGAATVGQLVGRAFVRGDLPAARDGLARGIAADLDNDDLVYYALWERLLERQLKAKTDGVADRIFSGSIDSGRWIGKIAQFGAGLLKAEDLLAAAQTPAQKTEALFYTAMDRRVSGDAKGADTALRQVVTAGGVDLMEVAIARDILSPTKPDAFGPLPSGVAVAVNGGARSVRRALDWGKIAPLRLRARLVAEGVYAGAHRSARRGAGVEFGGHRQYTPGDDLRWLDRRSLLLHDRLLVRQFETETDRALRLVVDATGSMGYRGKDAPAAKLAFAALVAAALARIAIGAGDPVGLTFIGDAHARGVSVSGGREAFERVVGALEACDASGDATLDTEMLDRALAAVARSSRRGSILVVMSDLLDLPDGAVDRISAMAARGRVLVVVQTLDPDEARFPFDGTVRLRALEGKAVVETDAEARESYLANLAALTDGWERALVARGARLVRAETGEDPVRVVRRVLEAAKGAG